MPVARTGVDFEAARAWVHEHIVGYPGRAVPDVAISTGTIGHGKNGSNGAGGYSDAVLEKLRAQGARERLKLEREKGSLVPEDMVQVFIAGVVSWFANERKLLPGR
jgi:hypothetical protein